MNTDVIVTVALAVALGVALGVVAAWLYGRAAPIDLMFSVSFRYGRREPEDVDELRPALGYTGPVDVDPSVAPVRGQEDEGEARIGFRVGVGP